MIYSGFVSLAVAMLTKKLKRRKGMEMQDFGASKSAAREIAGDNIYGL